MIRLVRALWARVLLLGYRHEHDWQRVHTVASGWTLYRCATCGTEEIG